MTIDQSRKYTYQIFKTIKAFIKSIIQIYQNSSTCKLKRKDCKSKTINLTHFFIVNVGIEFFRRMAHFNRDASRCWTSLLRWRTLKIYCRSWSEIPSKADLDGFILLLLVVVSAVESVENPVDASIIRWILEACGGVGGSRALRPLPIFLFKSVKYEKINVNQ